MRNVAYSVTISITYKCINIYHTEQIFTLSHYKNTAQNSPQVSASSYRFHCKKEAEKFQIKECVFPLFVVGLMQAINTQLPLVFPGMPCIPFILSWKFLDSCET